MALRNESTGNDLRAAYPPVHAPHGGDHGRNLYAHPSTNRPTASLARMAAEVRAATPSQNSPGTQNNPGPTQNAQQPSQNAGVAPSPPGIPGSQNNPAGSGPGQNR